MQNPLKWLYQAAGAVEFTFSVYGVWLNANREQCMMDMLFGDPQFAMQVYVALAAGGAVFLLCVNWSGILWLIERRRLAQPESQFHMLHDKILELIQEHDRSGDGAAGNDVLFAKSNALMQDLKRLKVPYPIPPKSDQRPWWAWLPRLYAFSCARDLHGARNDKPTWEKYFGRDDV